MAGPVERGSSFVGRAQQRAAICAAHDAVMASGRQVVLVEGAAGTGKTALVRWLLSNRPAAAVVDATAVEGEADLPFAVVDQLVAGLPGVRRASDDVFEVGAALLTALAELAASTDAPVVLVVEDVHWADRPSLQSLLFALRRLRLDRLLVVLTTRDPAPAEVVRLADSTAGTRLVLGPLSADEVGELAQARGAGRLTRWAAQRLWEHTGGLPLHVEALCAELDPGQLQQTEHPLPAPRSLLALVAGRLSSCGPETADLVRAVAVLGGRTDLARAGAVAGLADPAPALAEAARRGLLEEVRMMPRIEVRTPHPLLAAAVYEDLPLDRRRELHLRAAAHEDDDAALRHRAAAAIGPDDDLADDTEAHTGRLLQRELRRPAAAALLRASRLSSAATDRHRRLLAAVDLLLLDGDVAAAAAHEPEIAAQPDGAQQRLVLGQLAYLGGRQVEARHHLAAAWRLADGTERVVAARTAMLQAQLSLLQAEAAEARCWAQRALDVIEPGSPAAVEATSLLAMAEGTSGEGRHALALVSDVPSSARGEQLPALLARGIVRLWVGDLLGADGDLGVVAEGLDPWRPLHLRLSALGCRSKVAYRLGRWDDSTAHADLAVSLAEDSDQRWALSFLCSVASLVPAVRGEWAAAGRHVTAAASAAEESGGLATDRAYAAHAAAQLAFAKGDPHGVVAAIEPVLDLLGRDGFAETGVMPWRELYAEALIDVGRLEEAAEVAEEVGRAARVKDHPLALATADRVHGRLAAAQDRLDAADTTLHRAADRLAALDAPFDRALVEDLHGRILRRHGQRRRAGQFLGSACDAYDRLGAGPFLERCERERAACGLSPRRREPSRPHLTPQELAVSRLATQGRTNREIADELVISAKTVEYHLANTFTKLGIRSRRQLGPRLDP